MKAAADPEPPAAASAEGDDPFSPPPVDDTPLDLARDVDAPDSRATPDDGPTRGGPCPRCSTRLVKAHGALLEDVCPGCQGRFLPPEVVQRVVIEEMGHDPAFLRELAEHFAGEKLPCPGCHSGMSPVQLRSVPVDLCMGCSGVWLDPGELLRVSQGRYREVPAEAPPDPPEPAASDDDLASMDEPPGGTTRFEIRTQATLLALEVAGLFLFLTAATDWHAYDIAPVAVVGGLSVLALNIAVRAIASFFGVPADLGRAIRTPPILLLVVALLPVIAIGKANQVLAAVRPRMRWGLLAAVALTTSAVVLSVSVGQHRHEVLYTFDARYRRGTSYLAPSTYEGQGVAKSGRVMETVRVRLAPLPDRRFLARIEHPLTDLSRVVQGRVEGNHLVFHDDGPRAVREGFLLDGALFGEGPGLTYTLHPVSLSRVDAPRIDELARDEAAQLTRELRRARWRR